MRRFTVGLAASGILSLTLACGGATIEADTANTGNDRIVGGFGYAGLPAVGALTYYGDAHCTGTLIGPRTVLTAAHCVENIAASKMRFVIGASIYNPDYTLAVVGMEAHPNYNSYSITNDIGVVYLAGDAPVAPMKVLESMDASWRGTDLFFVGYGVTNGYTGAGAGSKRAVWMGISRVESSTFRYSDPGKNTCSGDSGGPAFYEAPDGTLAIAGVTSWGDGPCVDFGVDTRVDVYRDWLGINDEVTPPTPAPDNCGGETFAGRCSGASVVWCQDNQIHTVDCQASYDGSCGWDATNEYFGCFSGTNTPPPPDPCGGETFEGRCDGGSVIWCEDDEVKSISCNSQNQSCGWDGGNGYYNCM